MARQEYFDLQHQGPDGEILTIACTDTGSRSAEVILLVHGAPTSSWLNRYIIPLLAAAGYRVIAPDNLGIGSRSKPRHPDYRSHPQQAARFLELMDYLGVELWHQVPHDVAGPITSEMIEQNPDKIRSLTVLNTAAYSEGFDPPYTTPRSLCYSIVFPIPHHISNKAR